VTQAEKDTEQRRYDVDDQFTDEKRQHQQVGQQVPVAADSHDSILPFGSIRRQHIPRIDRSCFSSPDHPSAPVRDPVSAPSLGISVRTRVVAKGFWGEIDTGFEYL
jgi:hypothetical protein